MAIAGLLVHTLEDNLKRIETAIDVMPEMTTYGCHQCQYVVVVAEAPANQMEKNRRTNQCHRRGFEHLYDLCHRGR